MITESMVRNLILAMGDDPNRDGLRGSPARVIESYKELFKGYKTDVKELFRVFDNDMNYDEVIILSGVEFTSFCEHHLLPFTGIAHIGYVPESYEKKEWYDQQEKHHIQEIIPKIIGISKLARLLEVYSCRLQNQERITIQVTQALDQYLKPLGSACVLEANHMCIQCRGVKKTSTMITSSMTGCFREKPEARAEFFQLIRRNK
jgi:GTP cyclohydrolase I